MKVFFLQFIKGQWKTGEREILRGLRGVDLEVTGRGFTIERLRNPKIPLEDHAAAAAHGWQVAQQIVREGEYDVRRDQRRQHENAEELSPREIAPRHGDRRGDLRLHERGTDG